MSTKKSTNTNSEFSKKTVDNILSDIKRNMLWLVNGYKLNHVSVNIRDGYIKQNPTCFAGIKDLERHLHFGEIINDDVISQTPRYSSYELYIDYDINETDDKTVIEIYFKEYFEACTEPITTFRYKIGETEKITIVDTSDTDSLMRVNFNIRERLTNRVLDKDMKFDGDLEQHFDEYRLLKTRLLELIRYNFSLDLINSVDDFGKLMTLTEYIAKKSADKKKKARGTLEEFSQSSSEEKSKILKKFLSKVCPYKFPKPVICMDSSLTGMSIDLCDNVSIGVLLDYINVVITSPDKYRWEVTFPHDIQLNASSKTNDVLKGIFDKVFDLSRRNAFNGYLKEVLESYR
jgi:hypothetical protein